MRVGTTVLLKEGFCYQSYGWDILRPLGSLKHVLKFLDNYEVDEICIVRVNRDSDSFEKFKRDVDLVRGSISNSPLSFGGGIRSQKYLGLLDGLPIERIHFSSAFIKKQNQLISSAKDRFGSQAVVASLPIRINLGKLEVFNSSENKFQTLTNSILEFIKSNADEILIIDCIHEGETERFDFEIIEHLDFPTDRIIISGGIGVSTINHASSKGYASCLIENRVLHKENYFVRELS